MGREERGERYFDVIRSKKTNTLEEGNEFLKKTMSQEENEMELNSRELDRRAFSQLAAAAVGGMLAGGLSGCGGEEPTKGSGGTGMNPGENTPKTTPPAGVKEKMEKEKTESKEKEGGKAEEKKTGDVQGAGGVNVANILQEKHVCRGLNQCKGQGAGKQNECAGQGACATASEHSCGGQNECKGQGGCGEFPGQNACKGEGGCHVPLMENRWQDARDAFEKAMKNAEKKFGAAPEKKG